MVKEDLKKRVGKKTKKKYIFIKVSKAIPEIMNEYCTDSGISPHDVGYHAGYILSAREDLAHPLCALNQLYFFAGIHYAMKHKGKFEYGKKQKKLPQYPTFKELTKEAPIKPNYLG